MAESDLNKYLRELMTGGRPDLGLITSRRNPMTERQSSALQAPVAQPQAGRRFNYDSPVGAVPQGSDPGGFRGFLGDVAGVGRSALGLGLKSLGPLDWARRASLATLSEFDKLGRDDSFEFGDSGLANFGESVVETAFDLPTKLSGYDYLPEIVDNIREMRGIEAVDPVDRETVDERSWWEKFNDPTFGYGQILHDKSGGGLENALRGTRIGEIAGSVGDKAIGFAGDVVYDPTSYLTGGATAVAGKLNRFAAAAEIASKVGRVPGVTEEMVGRMASRGASAFSDAERALIDLPQLYQRGLRVGNPLGGKNTVRIPGTAQIDRLFSALVREPRHYVTSSKAYRKVVEARRAPQGQELMFDVLRRGKTDVATGVTPMQAAIALDAHNALKAAENLYKTQWSQGASGVFEGMDVESRRALTAATEQGQSDLTPLFKQIRDNLKAEGVDIGDITSLPGLDGYMPHVRTRAMTELMDPSKTSPDVAAAFNKAFNIDPTKRQSMTLRRTIRPGTTMKFNLGGEAVEITFERATIAEINEKLTEAFPQFGITKWLEDDAAILFSRYIDEAARSAGQVRMFERLLDEIGRAHV